MFKKLDDGTQCGITDGAKPENYSEKDLSEVHDAFVTLASVFGESITNMLWYHLPNSFRMDYNWTKWKYHARKRK